MTWPPGTSGYKIVEELGAAAGFLPPYFDAFGVLVCRPIPDLSQTLPAFSYGIGTTMVEGSVVESDNVLIAPNRYIVTGTGANNSPATGFYDIPDASPNSIAQRGEIIADYAQLQTVTTSEGAIAAAYQRYVTDDRTFTKVEFDAIPDPRHDTLDVVAYEGLVHLEEEWRLRCEAGAMQHHLLRRTYTDA
jgi:hypothetical protein